MKVLLGCLACLAVLASGCKRSGAAQTNTVIQEAVKSYIQKQSNLKMDNITVEVRQVQYDGDRATAEVNFRSKQQPDLVMGRHYVLHRADGQWQVESSTAPEGMGGPHGGPPLNQQGAQQGAQPGAPTIGHPTAQANPQAAPQASH